MAYPYSLLISLGIMILGALLVAEVVGRYAGTKGGDARRWANRSLLYGPFLTLFMAAFLRPAPRKFTKCPQCDRPVRSRSTTCWFCHSELPID